MACVITGDVAMDERNPTPTEFHSFSKIWRSFLPTNTFIPPRVSMFSRCYCLHPVLNILCWPESSKQDVLPTLTVKKGDLKEASFVMVQILRAAALRADAEWDFDSSGDLSLFPPVHRQCRTSHKPV